MTRRRKPRRSEEPPTALARVLDAQGRRLAWVADRLGVDASTVSRWRSGERPISRRRFEELAVVLEVDLAALVQPEPGRGAASASGRGALRTGRIAATTTESGQG